MDETTPQNKPSPADKGRLHGITLKTILERLVEQLGWDEMAYHVNINCFKDHPTINSSLKLLRKTPWARAKVEALYLRNNPPA